MVALANRWLLGLGIVACVPVGCLPKDAADDTGHVLLTVGGDEGLSNPSEGLDTVDGWHLEFKRYLVSLGDLRLQDCDSFTDTSYLRVVDLVGREPQKVEEYYGIGSCGLWFEVRVPRTNSPLGVGVEAAAREVLLEHNDSVLLEGTAIRDTVQKVFAFSINVDANFGDCQLGGKPYVVELNERSDVTVPLLVMGGAPFYDGGDVATANLRFDAFAAADDEYGNSDGEITVEELTRTQLDQFATNGNYSSPAGVSVAALTLLEYLRAILAVRLVGLTGGGTCSQTQGEGDFD